MRRALAGDRLFQFTMAALVAVSAPLFAPGPGRDLVRAYARFFSDLPLIVLLLVSLQSGLRRIERPAEQRFWSLWTAAIGAWLLQRLLRLVVSAEAPLANPRVGIVEDVLYACLYLFATLALETQPHRRQHPGVVGVLRWLEPVGPIVFVFGMLVYFAIIPTAVNAQLYATAFPSLLLYVSLDALLIARLAGFASSSEDPGWRATYALMLAATVMWAVTDSIELLMAADSMPWVAEGTPLDLLWLLPFPLLTAARRLRQYEGTGPGPTVPSSSPEPADSRAWGGPPMFYAVVLPACHFALYAVGVLDPLSRPARELCALVLLVALSGLSFVRQRLLQAENRRLERERLAAADSLQRSERMLALGALVAGVAHEVRNPLFALSATLDAFERRVREDDDHARTYIAHLRQALDRLSGLMEQLLDYGRPSRLALAEGGVRTVIDEVVDACQQRARDRGVRIVREIADDLPRIELDRSRMRQVFVNLVENALHYAPADSAVRIEASVLKLDGRSEIRCAVSDSGSGFKEQDLPQLFEPFFTERAGGTGLGLSIARRIVEDHGGEIWASNDRAGGARIELRLPVRSDPRANASPRQK